MVWATSTWMAIAQVASIAYQQSEAHKARKKAKAAEEARKGFELVVEGDSNPIPIVYGRAKVGGVRAWHGTSNNFIHAETNGDLSLTGGKEVTPDFTMSISYRKSVEGDPYTWNGGWHATTVSARNFITALRKGAYTDILSSEYTPTLDEYAESLMLADGQKIYFTWLSNSLLNSIKARTYTSVTNMCVDDGIRRVEISLTINQQLSDIQKDIEDNAETTILNVNKSGEKNEFLFFQQALCMSEINSVKDILIDESRRRNDSDINGEKSALRVDCHYDGGGADALITANFPEREKAYFEGISHAAVCIKLNRDEPQFSNVPMVQFFVEGRKVPFFLNSTTLHTHTIGFPPHEQVVFSRLYSNNPVLCLLDYLLDDLSGKALTLDSIDLKSFYDAHLLCNTVVASEKPMGGIFWENAPKDAYGRTSRVDIPLYECNMMIDTSKPLRENIESILSTMGDAKLVWSQGKYKLQLQYPSNDGEIVVAETINDDNLSLINNVEIAWPDTKSRFNSCTVRYSNEAENFKEDSASWPPKITDTVRKGVGGQKYTPTDGGWDALNPAGKHLNDYGVWDGNEADCTLTWVFVAKETGVHTLKYAVDDTCTVTVKDFLNNTIDTSSGGINVHTRTFSLVTDEKYEITVQAHNNKGNRGFAGRLNSPLNVETWNSRMQGFTDFIIRTSDATLYNTYLAEDNGVQLENDLFLSGTTDYYHALAKAEEIVRTSRTAAQISFKYIISNGFLEPGDIVKFRSDFFKLGLSNDLYIKVSEVKMEEGRLCQVTGKRFMSSQLAWNVADDEYVNTPSLYNFELPAPQYLNYVPFDRTIEGSSGRLEWSNVADSAVVGYILYMHKFGDLDENGSFIYNEIGRSGASPFSLASFTITKGIFGVRSLSAGGKTSSMTTTATEPHEIFRTINREVVLSSDKPFFVQNGEDTTFVNPIITLLATTKGYETPLYKWSLDGVVEVDYSSESIFELDAIPVGEEVEVSVSVYDSAVPTENTVLTDSLTIFSMKNGSNAYNIVLSDELGFIQCDGDGIPFPAEFPREVTYEIYKGSEISTEGTVTLSASLNLDLSLNTTAKKVTLTAINEISGQFTLRLTVPNIDPLLPDIVVEREVSFYKILQGVSSPLLILEQTGMGFVFDDDKATTTVSPAISIEAKLTNITGTPTWLISYYNSSNVLLGTTAPSAGLSITVSSTLFNTYSNLNTKYAIVECTLDTLTDTTTLVRMNNGEDAYLLYLTNQAALVPADVDGNLESTVGAETFIYVYKGALNVTNEWSISKSDSTGFVTDLDNLGTVYKLSTLSLTQAEPIGNSTITATKVGYSTLTGVFTVAKSREGAKGEPGVDGDPGTPAVDVPFIDISGFTGFVVNAGGLITPPSATLSARVENITSPSYTWSFNSMYAVLSTTTGASTVITPLSNAPYIDITLTVGGLDSAGAAVSLTKNIRMPMTHDGIGGVGQHGYMAAYPSIYVWTSNETPPARPSGSSTYSWSTGYYTAPSGWFASAPVNTQPGYVLWRITIPINEEAIVTSTILDWSSNVNPITAVAKNGETGPEGPRGPAGADGTSGTGAPGSASYTINRYSNSIGPDPTFTEVNNATGRVNIGPISGDIATILGQGDSITKQYIGGTWTPMSRFISGSMVIEKTLKAEHINVNTLSALSSDIGDMKAGYLHSASAYDINTGVGAYIDLGDTAAPAILNPNGTIQTPARYNRTSTFRFGNPTGKYIKWDGSNLTIAGGVITTDSIATGAVTESNSITAGFGITADLLITRTSGDIIMLGAQEPDTFYGSCGFYLRYDNTWGGFNELGGWIGESGGPLNAFSWQQVFVGGNVTGIRASGCTVFFVRFKK
jgi:hypothetical protein